QAEDGIRDFHVTGVQTCALPICGNANLQASVAQGIQSAGENGGAAGLVGVGMATGMMGVGTLQQPVAPPAPAADDPVTKLKKAKIGRASCRERGSMSVVDVAVMR